MRCLIIFLFLTLSTLSYAGGYGTGGGTATPEGTAILSTGEVGGNKFLREDGDGTCSWQILVGGGDLLANGTIPLTANWDVGAFTLTALQLHSDIVTGTAPLTVASTTVVTNLNADLLDGESASAFQDSNAYLTDIAGLTPVANNLLGWNAGATDLENKSTLTIGWGRYSFYEGLTDNAFNYRWDAGDPTASRDFNMVNIGSDALEWNWDQGAVVSTGTYGPVEVPWDCTIKSATLLADQTGSMEVDIWVDSYANYPPTIADTITASALPTITAGIKDQDEVLTGWTVSLSKGDIVYFVVNSASTIEKATLSLKVDK